jgi:hypothetical protein
MPTAHWTNREWQEIAERIYLLRASRPELGLGQVVKLAQERWPENRRKALGPASNERPELIERLKKIHLDLRESVEQGKRLKEQLQEELRPNRERLLASLSDDEIVHRFAKTVLARLAALATGGMISVLETYGQVKVEHEARQSGLRIAGD